MLRRLRRVLLRIALVLGVLALLGAGALVGVVAYYGRAADAVDVERLANWRPKVVTRIYARDGTELAALHFGERRTVVPLAEIPEHVVAAFLAAEDARFLEHGGFDPVGILRAAAANLLHGEVRQGASTITQQVIKHLLLSPERTLERKSQELWLAGRVERAVGKARILEIYLNLVYLGEGRYGVEEAARHYFGKSVREIGIAEAAVLAALPKAPGKVTPLRDPDRTWRRARWVLRRMAEEGFVDADTARALAEGPMPVRPPGAGDAARPDLAPEVVEIVRQKLAARFGAEALPTLGAKVTTTLDPTLQASLRAAAREIAAERGAEAAVVVADVGTGAVLAHVGGTEPSPGMFDRVRRARRQPASTFKPVVYGAALEAGTIDGATLLPVDDDGTLAPARRALARSNNRAATYVLSEVGAEKVHDFAQRLGIASRLHGHPSLALGTAEVTPLELLTAYGTIAASGRPFVPRWIERIEVGGAVVPPPEAEPPHAGIGAATAFRLTELLQAVVAEGTGRGAARLGRPVAGKTGTSDEGRDVWFAGFTADHVAVAWVGRDDHGPLGDDATGARLALPLWRDAMAVVSEGRPARGFAPPAGVAVHTVDGRTGGRACDLRTVWYVPPRCSGFWVFERCSPATTTTVAPHLVCSDPRAYVPLSLPARTPPPARIREGWHRVFRGPRVVLLGVSVRAPDPDPATPPPDAARDLAALTAWVDELDRALAASGPVAAGSTVARLEIGPGPGVWDNLRFSPGTPFDLQLEVRRLLAAHPPPAPPPAAAAGPWGSAHVQLGVTGGAP